MQQLDTYNLIVNWAVLIIMPLLIWANSSPRMMANAFSAYLWTEHRNFMRLSLVILGFVTLFAAATLLGHYGLLSPDGVELANMVIGIPFLFLAVIEIVLAVRGVLKFLRERRAGTSKI